MRGGTDRRWSFALGCGVAVLAILLSLCPAAAKSGVCRQLEAQLAKASTGAGASARVRKYDKAIAAQRNELAKARSRDGNCGLSLFGLGQCGGIDATIDKMERNLATLERERASLRGGASRRERGRIAAALDANGCRDSEAAERRLPQPVAVDQRNAELLRQTLGELNRGEPLPDELEEDGERNVRHVLNPSIGLRFEGMDGSFRTLCVRTCDGYFFPVSNQSTRADFDRDHKNCEATCPGAEVELFYQRTDAAGSDEIMSAATGTPYSQLPNAYLYKDVNVPRPATCGCAARPRNFSVIAGRTSQDRPPAVKSLQPVASGTHAGDDGGQPAGTAKEMPAPRPALPPPPSGQRKVRVVGPAFLPDRSGAIDLRAPARTAVR